MAQINHVGQVNHVAQMGGQAGGQMGHPVTGPAVVPSNGYGFGQQGQGATLRARAAPPRSNAVVYVLIVILMAAIGVLAYLVTTK